MHPHGARSSRTADHVICMKLLPRGELHTRRLPAGGQESGDFGAGGDIDLFIQAGVELFENAIAVFCAQMPQQRRNQVQPRRSGIALEFFNCRRVGAVEDIGGAMLQVDPVYILNQLLQPGRRQVLIQAAPEFRGESQLAVAEGPGTAPAAGDRAGIATQATSVFAQGGAFALSEGRTPVEKRYPGSLPAAQLQRGEDAGRTRPHNDDIVLFKHRSILSHMLGAASTLSVRAILAKQLKRSRKQSSIVPTGPLRCLAMIISAIFPLSVSR